MPKEMLFLTDVYTDWCKNKNYLDLVLMTYSMVLTLKTNLTLMQVTWLESFISTWDIINQNT